MFADVSGFTMLSEKLQSRGTEVDQAHQGPELLAKAINAYMELLSQKVSQSGGDIFKFAGDAMIILWTPPDETITTENMKKLCVKWWLIR